MNKDVVDFANKVDGNEIKDLFIQGNWGAEGKTAQNVGSKGAEKIQDYSDRL